MASKRKDRTVIDRSQDFEHQDLSGQDFASMASDHADALAEDRKNIHGNNKNNHKNGTKKSDKIEGRGGDDVLKGGGGADTLFGDAGKDKLIGDSGGDALLGGRDKDKLIGGAGNDRLSGAAGGDLLDGGTGNDRLSGAEDSDTLYGGVGKDQFQGGSGKDIYLYRKASESAGKNADIIKDFKSGDRIDLSKVSKNDLLLTTEAGTKNGVWVDDGSSRSAAGGAGQKGSTKLLIDTNGDGKADMTINLLGKHTMKSSDFKGVKDDPAASAGSIESVTIAGDNNVTTEEKNSTTLTITGVTKNIADGATVKVVFDGQTYSGTVSGNAFIISNVSGAVVAADADQKAEVTITSDGKDITASQGFAINGTGGPSAVSIESVAIAGNNDVTGKELTSKALTITGEVKGAADGAKVTVEFDDKTYSGEVKDGAFTIKNVAGSVLKADGDQIAKVTVTDGSDVAVHYQGYKVNGDGGDASPGITSVTIAGDNDVNATEVTKTDLTITGVTTKASDGAEVTVAFDGKTYTGIVVNNAFTINNVSGQVLAGDSDKIAQVTVKEASGTTSVTASKQQAYTSVTPGGGSLPSIGTVTIAGDNDVSSTETGSTTLTITGATANVADGSAVSVAFDGKTYTGTVTANAFTISNVSGTVLAADADKVAQVTVTPTGGTAVNKAQSYTVAGQAGAPTITGLALGTITGATTSGTTTWLNKDDTVEITVNFSAAVSVTGQPKLNLADSANGTFTASLKPGSPTTSTTTLTFLYTVQAGHNSADLAVSGLALNGGTIKASGNNLDAVLTIAQGDPDTTRVVGIDTTAPTGAISTLVVAGNNDLSTTEQSSTTLTITGTTTGIPDSTAIAVAFDGKTYSGTVTGNAFTIQNVSGSVLTADGDHVAQASLTLTDPAGNTAPITKAQSYTIAGQVTAPIVSGVSYGTITGAATVNGTTWLNQGDTVEINVAFSGPVDVTGSPVLDLGNGITASLKPGSAVNDVTSLTFVYTVAAGQTVTTDLIPVGITGGTIKDGATNTVNAVLTGVATDPNTNLIVNVDTTAPAAPTVTSVTIAGNNALDATEQASTALTITGVVSGAANGDGVSVAFDGKTYTGTVQNNAFTIGSVSGAILTADADKTAQVTVTTSDPAGNTATNAPAFTQVYTVSGGGGGGGGAAPTITGISYGATMGGLDANGNKYFNQGDTIELKVDFSAPVDVTGSPVLNLGNGLTATASLTSTSLTNISSLTFLYTVAAGHNSTDLTVASLTGGTIKSTAGGVAADLSLGNNGNPTGVYVIDTTNPVPPDPLTLLVTADNNLQLSEQTAPQPVFSTTAFPANADEVVTVSYKVNTVTTAAVFDVNVGAWVGLVSNVDLLLDPDKKVDIIVTSTDGAGNTASQTTVQGLAYTVEAPPPPIDNLIDIDAILTDSTVGMAYVGPAAGWGFGASVASVGDYNRDGKGDIIVGSANHALGGANAGGAYVFKTGSFATAIIQTGSLGANDGFFIQGDTDNDFAGWSVAGAGDTDGDGIADFLIGAPGVNPSLGRGYAVYGDVAVNGVITDLSTLLTSGGFYFKPNPSISAGANFGLSMASAGDLNNDGFDDFVVGSPYYGSGGVAAIIYGKASRTSLGNLVTNADATLDTLISDPNANEAAGASVGAGDFNGDWTSDIYIGTRNGDIGSGTSGTGKAYVAFNSNVVGQAAFSLGNISGKGITITGAANDFAGIVSNAGDVNADGFDDLIIGAPGNTDGSGGGADAYVIYGSASPTDITLGSLSSTQGFKITGALASDRTGFSVAAAGDVNGDGYGDIVVGAPENDRGGTNAGAAYIIFGKATGADINIASFTKSQGMFVQGFDANDLFGYAVSSAGDFDNDGFDDVLIGAPGAADGAGAAYVVRGQAFGASNVGKTFTGTSAAEHFVGGLGTDVFNLIGTNDSAFGGAGTDTFELTVGLGFRRIDGGNGADTVKLSAASLSLNVLSSAIRSVEVFDLKTNTSAQTIDVKATDIERISDAIHSPTTAHGHLMTFRGGSNDLVDLNADNGTNDFVEKTAGWTKLSGTVTDSAGTYNVWQNVAENTFAYIEVGMIVL